MGTFTINVRLIFTQQSIIVHPVFFLFDSVSSVRLVSDSVEPNHLVIQFHDHTAV